MGRVILTGLFAAAWVAASFVLAIILGAAWHVPVTGAFAFLVVAGVALSNPLARDRVHPRMPLAIALGVSTNAVWTYLAALSAINEPLVSSHFRCGTGQAVMILFAPVLLFVWTALWVVIAAVALAKKERRIVDGVLRAVVAVATLAAASLIVLASVRAARKPEPDRWLAQQAVTLNDVRTLDWRPMDAPPGADPKATYSSTTYAGRTLYRSCTDTGWCGVSFVPRGEQWGKEASVGKDEAMPLIRTGRFWIFGGEARSSSALDEVEGGARDVYARDVANELSAPRGFLACGAIAVALAAIAWIFGQFRRDGGTRGLRDGVVDADGMVLLDDGTRWPQSGLEEGTRVIATPATRIASFREGAAPTFRAGSLEDLRMQARARAMTWSAIALSMLLLGLAPLLAALQIGIAI